MRAREARRTPDGPALVEVNDYLSFMVVVPRYPHTQYYVTVHFDDKAYRWINGQRQEVVEGKSVRAHMQCIEHPSVRSLFNAPNVRATVHFGQLKNNRRRCTACGRGKWEPTPT